jgi:hypothetical protein
MLSRASGTQHPSGSQRVGCNLTQDVGRVDAEHFSSAEDRNAQPGEPKHAFSRSKALFLKTCRICAESGCDSNKVRVESATKLIGMWKQIFPPDND